MTKKSIGKVFSRIGFALVTVLLVGSLLQIAAVGMVSLVPGGADWYAKSSFGMMIVTFVPLYLIAFPLGFLLLRKLPRGQRGKENWKKRTLASYGIMCLPIMYLGNIIGTFLSMILSGGNATNAIEELLSGNIVIEIIFLVILAPLFEEFLFRKMIIDRTLCFGEKTAVLFSALTFGLFHGNLFQFFYTFGVGFIWAYVYVKTQKFSYPYILHAVFNFIGGIVPSLLMKNLGADNIAALENMDFNKITEHKGVIAVYGLYSMVLILLSVTGCVLLLRNRKNFVFEKVQIRAKNDRKDQSEDRKDEGETEEIEEEKIGAEEEKEEYIKIGWKLIWINPGMIVFSVLILFTFIAMLLA